MPSNKLLIADLLCGAGGSSTGAIRALLELGFTLQEIILVCVNHWPTAIETHLRNYPEARHHVQDIAAVRPHLIVPEGYLDLLMASPTCTHHSVARGGKPTSDQQRSDPWHIITWLTELRVKRIIIENVWEFIGWGPVDHRTGKPIRSRKGEYFRAWIETIKRLGFEPEWHKLNAADFGDATTRQRFILMARSDRRRVLWPVASHRKQDDPTIDLFRSKPWRPAREIIDWSIKGKSIFNRPKPLAPKTLARIHAGAVKLGWPEPFLVILRNHMTAQGLDVPLPAITASGTHIGLAEPIVLSQHSNGAPRTSSAPLPTITTGGAGADKREGCARPMLIEPTLVEPFVLSRHAEGAPRSINEPTPTQVAKHSHVLISPYYGRGSGETCTSADEPLPTVTSKGRFGMVVPVTQSGGGAQPRNMDQPLPTLTTAKGGEFAVVLPVTHGGGHDRAQDVERPLPTITGANRGELAIIESITCSAGDDRRQVHHDILFRMLEPHELAAAMGFNTEDQQYEFAGTKTEKIKQIGNAVSVAKMKACVGAIMADAAPKRKAVNENAFREAAE